MLFVLLIVSLVGAGSAQAVRGAPARRGSYVFQRQEVAPRGFLPSSVPTPERNVTNSSSDYFALTPDGRFERVQLVFPEGTQSQQQSTQETAEDFLLTPDGRLEKLQEEPVVNNEVVQFFKLTEDGRLEHIREEEIPVDAKEESGEYHVLLPSGSLQRVRFMSTTKNNLLSAKVQYQEVEPIQGPVYQYAAPLVRVV